MERSRSEATAHGPRRLSALDAAFLYFERPNQPFHVGCVAEIEGRVPFRALVELIQERLCTWLPRYTQRPQRAALDFDHPRWEPDPGFDVRRHVRHLAVPAPGSAVELHALIDALHTAPLDTRHPLWEIHLIDGLADGSSALYFKMHHCMVDGVSGAQILDLITDAAEAAEAAVDPARETPAAPPPDVVPPPRKRAAAPGGLLGLLPSRAEIASRARDAGEMVGTIASLVREPSDVLPFNRPLGDRRAVAWATLPFDELHAVRGRMGCKLNDVVLAVITGALHRWLEAHGTRTSGLRVRAIVPVSMRREEDHLQLGNLVSAMVPSLPIAEPDPALRLRRIAAEMQELKGRGQPRAAGFLLALLDRLPAPFEALLGRLAPEGLIANTVCTNVPGPRQLRSLLGHHVRAVHAIAPLFQSMGLEFAVMSYADTVSISATADPDLVPDLDEVAAGLEAAARELVEATRDEGAAARAMPEAGSVPRVAELMSQHVVTVEPGDSLLQAHQLMRARRIRHLPVLASGDRLVGIITQRDVIAAAASSLEHESDAARARILATGEVGEVMETHVCTASPGERATDAGERMVRLKIGCLPVVGDGGRLVGIVTEEDFVHWAIRHMMPGEQVGKARARAASA